VISELAQYLEYIKYRSRLSPSETTGIISELETHLEDSVRELTENGLSEEEATRTCLDRMGGTGLVARRIYEAYSQGSWTQALLAAMPHLLFGLLFVLNWWHYAGWLTVVLLLTLATTVYGWWHGKPTWVFSWLGYTLLPIIVLGILLLYLPNIWSLLTLVIYLPVAMWWLFRIVIHITKKDWLFSTVMLMPLPIIVGWFIAVSPAGKLDETSLQRLNFFAPWIGLSFIVLALTIAVFLRLRQRALRIGLLAASGVLTLSLVVYYTFGRLNTLTFLGLMLVMWGVLLVPPVLERYLRRNERIYREYPKTAARWCSNFLGDNAGRETNEKGSRHHGQRGLSQP
jgi:hypothetical protein